MGYAKRMSRLGGLAIGFGVGAALAAAPGIAAADTTDAVVPVDGGASAVLGGDTIVPVSYAPEDVISTVTNPFDTQVIGDQAFYLQPPGDPYGNEFYATVNDTTFSYGPTDQYIDVYFSNENLPPAPDSIINVLNYGGGFENAYASIEGSAPADELITPFGNFAVPTGIVEFLGPSFFIPSVETTPDSAANVASAAASTATADLLGQAATNFTGAEQAFNGVPATELPDLVLYQANLSNTGLVDVTGLGEAQNGILSFDNGEFASLVTPLFNDLDQNWVQASDALLNANTALVTSFTDGTGLSAAEFGVIAPDLQVLSDQFLTGIIDQSSSLLSLF